MFTAEDKGEKSIMVVVLRTGARCGVVGRDEILARKQPLRQHRLALRLHRLRQPEVQTRMRQFENRFGSHRQAKWQMAKASGPSN